MASVVHPSASTLVRDVMVAELVTVRVDSGLADAAGLLERHQISGMPVLDDGGALVGVLSESDLLRARATDYLWASWPTLRVKHLMTTPALTIRGSDPLTLAARRMERHHVSRLVVVADQDESRAIGVVAISDLLRVIAVLPGDTVPEPLEPDEAGAPMDIDGIGDRGD
jgi:CBS domain-containing protein